MREESWLPVVGYEGLYEVSDLGRVRSLDRVKARKGGQSWYVLPGRYLKLLSDRHAYRRVSLYRESRAAGGRAAACGYFVHRLVAMAFLGTPGHEQTDVNHRDCNPSNNTLGNLEWATRKENMVHASVNGLLDGTHASISDEDVAAIREMGVSRLYTQKFIAKTFGIRQQTVSKLLGRTSRAFGSARGSSLVPKYARALSSSSVRLTPDAVRHIRSVGYTQSLAELAALHGVTRSTIQCVRSGETWKHIT